MTEIKTLPTDASVDEFINSISHPGRKQDAELLLRMMKIASGTEPVMWGKDIVGFGSFHYRYASGHEGDMPVISFSPRKAAMSVYGVYYPGYEVRIADIGPYKTGKWCLYLGRFTSLNLERFQDALKWAWNNGTPVIASELSQ
jgi:hypothetical protein